MSSLIERITNLGFNPTPELQDEIQRIAMSKISDSTITAAWRAQRKATKEREAAVKAVAASFPPALVIAPQANDPAQS